MTEASAERGVSKIARRVLLLGLVGLSGCATTPPAQQNNVCDIFREKPRWYKDALAMEKEWGNPDSSRDGVCQTRKQLSPRRKTTKRLYTWVYSLGARE